MEGEDIPGLILCTDFEKAFDSLNWNFMLKTMDNFNFGPSIIQWIKTFYKDISACTINNGHTSGYFKLERGVRQGDPLSPYVFILVMEILAHAVRQDNEIKGIKIASTEMKVVLYADDNSGLFPDTPSAENFLKVVTSFGEYSGLKLNKGKTEAMWLGSKKGSEDKPLNVNWNNKTLKILGIYVGHDKQEMYKANYEAKIESLKTILNIWKMRDLTLNGRILVSKMLGVSKFDYVISALPMTKETVIKINNIIWNFIWKGKKKGKIKKDILICEHESGGQKMLDLETRIKTSRLRCLKRFFYGADHDWKIIFNNFFYNQGGINIAIHSNLGKEKLLKLPTYQQEVMQTWLEAGYRDKVLIWNNKDIKISSRTVFNRSMLKCGIWYPHDLFTEGKPIPFDVWVSRGLNRKHFMLWRGLINAVIVKKKELFVQSEPSKLSLKTNVNGTVSVCPLETVSSKEMYKILLKGKLCLESPGRKKHNEEFHFDNITWNKIYTLYGSLWKNKKIQEFQYKVLQNIVALNPLLLKMGIKDTDKCTFCNLEKETLYHLLYRCTRVIIFWRHLEVWLNTTGNFNVKISEEHVLFGDLSEAATVTIWNSVMVLGKYYIYGCKLKENNPELRGFQRRLKEELMVEKEVAIKTNKIGRFLRKWEVLLNILQN